ncbi:hypothetical protein P7C70_g906, partial [Phenoliferia sp. Uapishka_3]
MQKRDLPPTPPPRHDERESESRNEVLARRPEPSTSSRPAPAQYSTRQGSPPPSQRRRREQQDWDGGEMQDSDDRDDDRQHSDTEMQMDQDDVGGLEDGSSVGARDDGPAKKRSRTLTTAHQTAVLNALLAKTRFPSTETREEVGHQIGMSARRVQIWFQNRRQSQKRARDRETIDGGSLPVGTSHVPSTQDYLFSDPYNQSNRYSTGSHQHPSSRSHSRQQSVDSLASFASYTSAQTSLSVQRPDDRSTRWPAPSSSTITAHPTYRAWPIVFPSAVNPPTPRGLARVPHPPAKAPTLAPTDSQNKEQSRERSDTFPLGSPYSNGEVKLPSLSSVVGSALPQSAPHVDMTVPSRVTSPELFAYQPPPISFPSSNSFHSERTVRQPMSNSAVSSPTSSYATLPRVDTGDFSRLRISGTPSNNTPISSMSANGDRRRSSGVTADVLDDAMETMYRPARCNPPRSELPPLRLRSIQPLDRSARSASEADALLLAPIRKASSMSSALAAKQSVRLPPISSFTPSTHSSHSSDASNLTLQQIHLTPREKEPLPPAPAITSSPPVSSAPAPPPLTFNFPPQRTSTFSHSSSQSSHSLDTLGSHLFGGDPSLSSSRTSFSSEVTEEWEKHSVALGGSMRMGGRRVSFGSGNKLASVPLREEPWEFERPATFRRSPGDLNSVQSP